MALWGASAAKTEFSPNLWTGGGVKDIANGSSWEEDTIVNVFSSTKGIIALGVNMLIDRGLLSIDAPVARYLRTLFLSLCVCARARARVRVCCILHYITRSRYWPEFEAEGKGALTVGQLLSHQAGLTAVPPVPGADIPFAIMLGEDGWTNTVNALAAAKPAWSPAAQLFEYHGMTFGHLAGELIRRVSGQSVVEFLRENILAPLGVQADVVIGMDESEFGRVAVLADGDGRTDTGTPGNFNAPETRKAVIPSANGHTNGRALARIYSAVANVRCLL